MQSAVSHCLLRSSTRCFPFPYLFWEFLQLLPPSSLLWKPHSAFAQLAELLSFIQFYFLQRCSPTGQRLKSTAMNCYFPLRAFQLCWVFLTPHYPQELCRPDAESSQKRQIWLHFFGSVIKWSSDQGSTKRSEPRLFPLRKIWPWVSDFRGTANSFHRSLPFV